MQKQPWRASSSPQMTPDGVMTRLPIRELI
jgi:hypothetical protein